MHPYSLFSNLTRLASLLAVSLGLLWLTACQDENETGLPVIERVRPTGTDTNMTSAPRGAVLAIIGQNLGTTQRVLFNGTPAIVNPAYVTNQAVIISVPEEAPYRAATQEIKLITQAGETTYQFSIQPPAPVISSFFPGAGGSGDTVTIRGRYFDALESVYFGTIPATVISSSDSIIRVKVPEGVSQANISVTALGGTVKSTGLFGFSFLIFEDALPATNWYQFNWSSDLDMANTERVRRGKHAIKVKCTGGYAGFGVGSSDMSLTDYQAIKFSVYLDDTANRKMKFFIPDIAIPEGQDNSNTYAKVITLQAGTWNEITIRFSEINNPKVYRAVIFQEFEGAGPTFYIDDIGLL